MSKLIELKRIAEVITGFPFKGDLYSENGIRTVRGENVTEGNLRWDTIKCWNQKFDKEDDYLLKTNDIVIGMDGSKVGKNKARIKELDLPLLLAQRVACVRAKKNNDQIFLYYLINNPRFEEYVFKTQTGSSVPHISKSQIEDYEVPQIGYKEQQKIAAILSVLDDKIALNNRINAELEAMAKTVYDYWFVQFDFPFDFAQGKPSADGKPYKSSGGKMVWSEELKREVPEGWEVRNLFSAMDVQYGFPFSTEYFTDETTLKPVVRIRDILENSISTYTNEDVDDKYMLLKNDLIIGMDGNFHLNFWYKTGAYLNQRSVRIRSIKDSNISSLQAYFELRPYIKAKENSVSRTTVGHLSDKDLKGLYLLDCNNTNFKPKDFFDPILDKITTNRVENQQLSSLRDWLLPMLMNGQVKVGSGYEGEVESLMAAEAGEKYGK